MIRLERWLAAALLAGIAEAGLVVVRAPAGVSTSGTWLNAFAFTTLCALAAAAVIAPIIRVGSTRRLSIEGLVAALFWLPPLLAVATLAGRFFATAFSNVELVAFLSALATLAATAAAACGWFALRARLEHWKVGGTPRSRTLALALGVTYLALAVAISASTLGLRLLDPGLGLTAVTAIAAWFATRWLPRVAPALLASIAVLPVVIAIATRNAEPAGFSLLARHGSWSKAVVHRVRALADRDGDGFSAWFAGGDCDDRDARVHPGAREVARDGLDNDCAGGDATATPRVAAAPAYEIPESVPQRPNLVIVTIETLRPDHLSLFGYGRPTTPRLEALAATSLVFERTYAAAPATRLSLAALFSGRTPSSLEWLAQPASRQTRRLGPTNPWLPELLRRTGYRTLAVHTNFRAFTKAENTGFERGFEIYDSSVELAFVGGALRGFPGAAQVNRALELIDAGDARPFALWLHLVEPHYLYEQSRDVPRFGDDELARYDAEIAEADRQLGRLLDALAARSLLERTLLVVSGDHGEEFGEHGQRFHATNLYEAQVRTALLLRVPGLPAERVREPVVLTDLAPTLVDLLRLPPLGAPTQGRNLLPRLLRKEPLKAGFLLENFRVENGAARTTALVEWPFKLIYDEEGRTLELYDLERDPLERANLYAPGTLTAEKLRDELHSRLSTAAQIRPSSTP